MKNCWLIWAFYVSLFEEPLYQFPPQLFLHSHQQHVKVTISSQSCQLCYFQVLGVFLIAILVGVKHLTAVLICISVMTNEVEHLFLCLSPFGEMSLCGLCPFFNWIRILFNLRAEQGLGDCLSPVHTPPIYTWGNRSPDRGKAALKMTQMVTELGQDRVSWQGSMPNYNFFADLT